MDRLTFDGFESAVDAKGSPHFLDLQIRGSCSNHKEQGDIFPDLFQDFIVDPAIQEASSLSLGAYLDTPIFVMRKKILRFVKTYCLLKFHLVLLFSREMIQNVCML